MNPVSVTIITLNEEDRIAAAVASAAWAAEVVVLDSGSDDRTVEVATAAGARAVVESWRGYGAQKNRAAELGTHDWVLSIDADERVTPELARAIGNLPASPIFRAFSVRRLNHFEGRPIRHWPWAWDTPIRLYHRVHARFSERAVHERLQTVGPVGRLGGVLEHHSYRGPQEYLDLQQHYARLGAEERAAAGRQPMVGDLTLRPALTLLRHLIGRGYLLGGVRGLRLSRMAARGTRLKYEILSEIFRCR